MSAALNLELKQHFTNAQPINNLMCRLLGKVDDLKVLEPCVGHGAFLSGLLGKPAQIDVIDIDGNAIQVVRENFKSFNIELFKADFIDIFIEGIFANFHPIRTRQYDAVIANPPYGLYFDLEYRKRIKKAFPHLYARESYGLFFAFAISCLKEGGRYSFLIPDTFLSSTNHRSLRDFICSQAAPKHIIRFPSKVFETVNFGYGNLCIISGTKKALETSDIVYWVNAFDDKFLRLDVSDSSQAVSGSALLQNTSQGWSSATITPRNQRAGWCTLGELAECRTGIYTGNNERFIGYDAHRVTRRLNGHPIKWKTQVCDRPMLSSELQDGIEREPNYVPLIRGGHRHPFDETAWAIRWDKEAIDFYKNNKKARFQNTAFYFKSGLSVPMVTTARISAALMSNAVFDQGVVGVFPRDESIVSALLLYLNSTFASQTMKEIINGSANNSANYLKRLPVPIFSKSDIKNAEFIVEKAKYRGEILNGECDTFVSGIEVGYQRTVRDEGLETVP